MEIPSVAQIEAALATRVAASPGDVMAATMACLRDGTGGLELLLCRRTVRHGDVWSGQISLPGGMVDAADADALATAVRETREEVGIDLCHHGRILGPLPPVQWRRGGAVIQAFVAIVADVPELAVSSEHAAAWWSPVAALQRVSRPVPQLPEPTIGYLVEGGDGREAFIWGLTFRTLEALRGLG